MSLLLRWWWRLHARGNMLWKYYASSIYALRPSQDGPLLLSGRGSFFWNYLHRLKPLFFSCAQFELKSGKRVSFWSDGWVGQPLAHDLLRPPAHRDISVHDAKSLWPQLLPTPLTWHHHLAIQKLTNFVPTTEDDQLRWLLSSSGTFSAQSVYSVLSQGGKIKTTFLSLWKAKVTPSMKLFCFFLLSNKLLTHENMQKRHLTFTPRCVLCNQAQETTMHLFFHCHFSQQIWSAISSLPGHSALTIGESPLLTYTSSIPTTTALRPLWLVTFITTTWLIWRERNNRTFRQATAPTHVLLANIQHEATLCLKYC